MNYQIELEKIINRNAGAGRIPSLLLHSCCAPCSSSVIEFLSPHFQITVFYFNPNIYSETEYRKREEEQRRFLAAFPAGRKISYIEGSYENGAFLEAVKGFEDCAEGGERCRICYLLRLTKTAEEAEKGGFDYFTTTLTISPLKNAAVLNETGMEASKVSGSAMYLPSDFKKRGGYQRSIVLSKEYQLYRQNFCGCIFSL